MKTKGSLYDSFGTAENPYEVLKNAIIAQDSRRRTEPAARKYGGNALLRPDQTFKTSKANKRRDTVSSREESEDQLWQ